MKTLKSRLILLGTLLTLVIIGTVAKAEEQKTVTPQEFVNSVVAVPGKIQTHLQTEWVEIKAYQAESWANAKAQNQRNWEKLKSLFNTTKTTN